MVRRCDGFSYLEVVLVIVLIGTLVAVAATRLIPYVSHAERVAVMRMEGQLRNALMMEAAMMIARGQSARLAELDHANPMTLMLEPPGNYLGELDAPVADRLPARSWHFDTARGQLVYRAGSGFESASKEPVIHDYVVMLAYENLDGSAGYAPGADEFHGLRLVGPGLRLQ